MSRKAATTLAALLVFGTASTVLADANNRTDYLVSFGQRPGVDDVQQSHRSRE